MFPQNEQQHNLAKNLSNVELSMPKTVLIFDSGMGGLTIYHEVKRRLPKLNYIYAFDNVGFPYGDKSDDVIIQRVNALIEKISQRHTIDIGVIACNTASTIVLPSLREKFEFPVVGVVPAIKPAAELTKNGIIGLLATKATINRRYTRELIQEYAPNCQVKTLGISELAIMAEKKLRGEPVNLSQLKSHMSPWLNSAEAPDTIVLGCTHYPLLKEELRLLFPADTQLIDSGEAIAKRVESLLNLPMENQVIFNMQKNQQHTAICTKKTDETELLHRTLEANDFSTLLAYQIAEQ